MPTQIFGLPAHVLLIHAIVVLAPLGALLTILSAVWPVARRRVGIVSPLVCLGVLALTPVTTNAGEWLEDKLTKNGPNEAIERHADLGETFIWFAAGLFVVSAAVWWLGRMTDRDLAAAADAPSGPGPGTLTRTQTQTQPGTQTRIPVAVRHAVAAVAVLMSVAAVVQLYRIGDAGAHATWDYVKNLK